MSTVLIAVGDEQESNMPEVERQRFLENLKQIAAIEPYGWKVLEAALMTDAWDGNNFEAMGEWPEFQDLLEEFISPPEHVSKLSPDEEDDTAPAIPKDINSLVRELKSRGFRFWRHYYNTSVYLNSEDKQIAIVNPSGVSEIYHVDYIDFNKGNELEDWLVCLMEGGLDDESPIETIYIYPDDELEATEAGDAAEVALELDIDIALAGPPSMVKVVHTAGDGETYDRVIVKSVIFRELITRIRMSYWVVRETEPGLWETVRELEVWNNPGGET